MKSNNIPTETKSNSNVKDSNRMRKGGKNKKKKVKTVSVYIDAENIPAKYADAIMDDVVLNKGKVKDKRYYNRQKDGSTTPWKEPAKEHKIKNISMSGEPEPNKIDNKIKKDIRKSLESGHAADIIVIATSDGGYIDIVNEIKDSGKEVIIVGEKKTPKKLRNAATEIWELTME